MVDGVLRFRTFATVTTLINDLLRDFHLLKLHCLHVYWPRPTAAWLLDSLLYEPVTDNSGLTHVMQYKLLY